MNTINTPNFKFGIGSFYVEIDNNSKHYPTLKIKMRNAEAEVYIMNDAARELASAINQQLSPSEFAMKYIEEMLDTAKDYILERAKTEANTITAEDLTIEQIDEFKELESITAAYHVIKSAEVFLFRKMEDKHK